jgi:hypothetical protein
VLPPRCHFAFEIGTSTSRALARKLEAFPEGEAPRQQRYPWKQWTDGNVWEIRRGEDYDTTTEHARQPPHEGRRASIQGQDQKVRDDIDRLAWRW